jgi:methionine-rich copper-binding protein CopC
MNTDYYVHVDPTALKDAAGNAFAGFTDNTTWNFNTNDVIAPALAAASALSPADNAAGVNVATDLSVTFTENVQAGTGLIELYDGSNTLVESFDAAVSPLVTISGATVTIDPTNDLAMNTDYYVHIAAGAIEDISGNDYAGIANNTTWNFNTNDLVAPTAVPPFTPADNATNVATAGNFSITFSEDMVIPPTGALSFTIHESNGTVVAGLASGDPGLSITGSTLNVTTIDLEEQTSYYINIDPGFITDLAGNAFAGIADQTTWNFTTGDFTAPAVSGAFTPADNATLVPETTDLSVTFDEDIAAGTGMITLMHEDGSVVDQFDIATSPDVTISGATLTVDLGTLGFVQSYYVTIDSAAILDLSGNAYDGISDSTAWNFETESDVSIDELSAAGIHWNGTTLSIDATTPAAVHLFDASGKIVKANLGQTTDCSALTPGIYLVVIRTESSDQTFRIYVR